MGFFDAIGSIADGISDMTSNLNVTVGNTTFEDVFTTAGEIVGNGWGTIGELVDEATKDITIDMNDIFNEG